MGGVAVVAVVAIVLLAGGGGQQQAQPDAAEVLASVGDVVAAVTDSDVRYVQQLMAAWDVANRNYLIWAMPYSLAMVSTGVLGFGLVVAIAILARKGVI